MEEHIVKRMCELARKNLVYLSYGEWEGSPEKLSDLDASFLLEMKMLCEMALVQIPKSKIDE